MPKTIALLLMALAASGCDTRPSWPHPLPPIAELPWPAAPAPLPVCAPLFTSFTLPPEPLPDGRMRVSNGVQLVPTGVPATLELEALDASGAADAAAGGEVTLDLAGAGAVVSRSPMFGGRARVQVRLDRPGPVTAVAGLRGDGRRGLVRLIAYESQLPIWNLTIDPARLRALEAAPHENQPVPARLTVAGVEHETAVRLHGGTSRDFPKKSFRFNLARGAAVAGRRRLILRGEWNDKTLLRNWLAHEVFRRATWLPTPATEFVHFRVNGEFYGLMLDVERIDGDFLKARGLPADGDLYEADPPLGGRVGDLAPLPEESYAEVYDHHAGAADHAALRRLIEDVLPLSPRALADVLPGEVAVDDVLVYLAAMAVVQNHDHVRKNYYLYRPPGGARGWMVLPWDLDLSFGHMWTETGDVLDERIETAGDPFVGSLIGGQGQHNVLTERLLAYPELRERMVALTQHIANTVLTPAFLTPRIDYAMCRTMPELLTDQRKRAPNPELAQRIGEITSFARARAAVLRDLR